MKIKELFENMNKSTGKIIGYIAYDNVIRNKNKNEFQSIINKKFPGINCLITIDKENVEFTFDAHLSDMSHINNIVDYITTQSDIFIGEDSTTGGTTLKLFDIPDHPIKWEAGLELAIDCTHIESLKGIEKIILQTDLLILINLQSGTGILSLCKLKNVDSIEIPKNDKLDSIANQFLGSNDVIAFSEALIEAGLKEYAKS